MKSALRSIHLFGAVTAFVGIVGGVPATAGQQKKLEVSIYAGAGDSAAGSVIVAEDQTSRVYTGIQASATFMRQTSNRTITASLGNSVRFFPDSHEFVTLDRSASIGVDARIGNRNHLRATQTIQYTPYRQFGSASFGSGPVGELPVSNPDGAATVGRPFLDFVTSVDFTRSLSRRSSLSLAFGYRLNALSGSGDSANSRRAGVTFRHVLGRRAALRLGTTYRFGRTGIESTALPTTAQDIDLGIDYNRPLSFSRNTTLTFTSGTALVSRADASLNAREPVRQVLATGAVTAIHTLGSFWEARLAVDRNLQFIDGYPDPFYTTRVSSRLSGQIGRRLNVIAQADYSMGNGIETLAVFQQSFRGLQSQAHLKYKLSRSWQLVAQHQYTENQLSAGALLGLPSGVVSRPKQHAVWVGLNLVVR